MQAPLCVGRDLAALQPLRCIDSTAIVDEMSNDCSDRKGMIMDVVNVIVVVDGYSMRSFAFGLE